jgi:hypothetical protein
MILFLCITLHESRRFSALLEHGGKPAVRLWKANADARGTRTKMARCDETLSNAIGAFHGCPASYIADPTPCPVRRRYMGPGSLERPTGSRHGTCYGRCPCRHRGPDSSRCLQSAAPSVSVGASECPRRRAHHTDGSYQAAGALIPITCQDKQCARGHRREVRRRCQRA